MSSELKRWEGLKAEYLRQVEKAVSSVKHPRARDVLEDVQSHLDQRFTDLGSDRQTLENMKAILDEMGPAADYAELLDTEPAPTPTQATPGNPLQIGVSYGVTFIISLFLAFGIAYKFQDFNTWFCPLFLPLLVPVLIIKLIVFGGFKFYRGWKVPFWKIFVAGFVGNFLFVGTFFLCGYVAPRNIPSLNDWIPFEQFRQIIFLLDSFCTLVLVWGITLVHKRPA
jgi:hypothetical protein